MNSETFYSRFFHFFLLCLSIIICYSNTLHAPWHFDDFPNIVERKEIHWEKITLESIKETFFRDGYGGKNVSRPIPRLTFAFNYYLTGLDTLSYHLTNISIHIITALFAYLVFLKTLELLKTKEDIDFSIVTCREIALLGAILWAIHPLQTQAVTYIVQRMASMAAMFYIMGMFFYIQGRLTTGYNKFLFLATAILCWIFGILSKENAVLLPLSIIIYELIFFGLTKKKIILIISLTIFFVLGIISVLLFTRGNYSSSFADIYTAVIDKIFKPYIYRPFTMEERLLTESRILVWYLFLIICPVSDFLSLESDIVISSGLFRPNTTFISIILIVTILLYSTYYFFKFKIISFALLFFFINHMVESTIVGLELYFEHRNYLPSMFIYLAIAYYLSYTYTYLHKNKKVLAKFFIVIFIVGILVSQGNATFLRNDMWKNEIFLMEDSIKKAPENIRPYISVSTMYMRLNMFDKARQYLIEAENLYKKDPERYQVNFTALLYYTAAILYTYEWEKKDIDKAISLLYKSCELYPVDHLPHAALGALLFQKGEYQQAEQAMVNASLLQEDLSPVFYSNFGHVLYSNGKINEAISAFLDGLQIKSSDTLRLNLVAAHLKKGDIQKAKNVLNEIPNDNDSPAYLLSYALLNPDKKGDLALEKLASLLVENRVSYCEWVEKINNNNLLGIIYPDIKSIESILKSKYFDQLNNARNKIDEIIMKQTACGI